MAIKDIYPNTPGFVAQINDYGLQIPPPTQALTQSVLLLGVAIDGPSNTPVRIQSIQDAERIFGVATASTSVTGAAVLAKTLTRGVYEAFQAGCTDIRLCRVGGVAASATLVDSGTAANGIVLTAGYPGAKYNALTVTYTAPTTAASGTLTITTLDGIANTFTVALGSLYGDLMNAVNNSQINVQASQVGPNGNILAAVNLTNVTVPLAFTGGSDGTNVTDAAYSTALIAAYRQLEDYATDVIVPLGAYLQPGFAIDGAGNPTIANTNGGDTVFFGQNLAQFVARMSLRSNSAIGIISVSPLLSPTFTAVNQRAASLVKTVYTFNYTSDYTSPGSSAGSAIPGTDGQPVSLGRFINIVAGPDFLLHSNNFGNYVMDAAPTYAGKVVSLVPQSATTNKPINGPLGLSYTFGASTRDTLVGQSFVVFNIVNGSTRTVADQTYALSTGNNPTNAKVSDFVKLSTVRITYAAVEAVRQATQAYIGEGNTPAITNAMATDIDGALKALKVAGALIDYRYDIIASSADQISGNSTVRLILTPALQIRKIIVDVRLKPPAPLSASGGTG